MADSTTSSLPSMDASPGIPGTLGSPQPPQRDPSRSAKLIDLIRQYYPQLAASMSGGQGQPPQGQGQPQVTPARVTQPPPQQSAPPALEAKFDPMSVVGSLPHPVEQPAQQGFQPSSGAAEVMSKMDPRGAAIYSGVQGITQFLQDSFQKKDQQQHSEAANAAQALMAALEGAKTTGDYRPAQHILENNEALFNKVYKGWLQKSEEAKKPQKKGKPPDPDVVGFEKGLAEYMGKGGTQQPGAPQPPESLQGRSGAKYMMPQASPPQAQAQQALSAESQASRQDPNRDLQSQLSSGEQRQGELGKAGLAITPAIQAKMNEYAVQYAKLDNERQKSETDFKKAQVQYDTELKKAGFASEDIKNKLQKNQVDLQKANVQLDIARQKGQLELMKAKNGGTVPPGYRMRWQAVTKAEELLNSADGPLDTQQMNNLKNLLKAAGATNLAASLPATGMLGGVKNWLTDNQNDPKSLMLSLKDYKSSLKDALRGAPSWLEDDASDSDPSGGDGEVDKSDDTNVITVSPEDMK